MNDSEFIKVGTISIQKQEQYNCNIHVLLENSSSLLGSPKSKMCIKQIQIRSALSYSCCCYYFKFKRVIFSKSISEHWGCE